MAEQVEFHTGVEDVLDFTCRLLRKAQRQGAQLVCTAPPATLAALDQALWIFEEREFVPHVRWPSAAFLLLQRTPIWLSAPVDEPTPPSAWAGRVLVNLGAPLSPAWVLELSRVIEVLGAEEGTVARGRERWRAFQAAGLKVMHHGAATRKETI
jgi:DNA polymerase III subunit chi